MMNKAIILFLGVTLMASCSDKEDPIGKWDDIIKLSTKDVQLSAGADSATVTTEGDWWWIDGIAIGDTVYSYYGNDDVNLESESYTIIENNFTVERRDKNTLFVKLDANTTGNERLMRIYLEAGDYFDFLDVQQATD